jgi:type IV pilus assembly protein PilX
MHFPMQHLPSPGRQRGAVLFVALVFLLLLTLIGVTASSTSILQERMTGGMRNAHLAGIGTESGLRGGEVDLWAAAARSNGAVALPSCGATGVQPCLYTSVNTASGRVVDQRVLKFRTSQAWLDSGSDGANAYSQDLSTLGGDYTSSNLASQPRYIIEDLGVDTGGGTGRNSATLASAIGGPGTAPTVHVYRITARSQGGSTALMRAAESVFGANFVTNFNNSGTP